MMKTIFAAGLFVMTSATCPWGMATGANGQCDCFTGWTPQPGQCCSPNSVYNSGTGCSCISGTSWNAASNTCAGKVPTNCPWGTVGTSSGTCVCRSGWWAASSGQCCSPNSYWQSGSGCVCNSGATWNANAYSCVYGSTPTTPTAPPTLPPTAPPTSSSSNTIGYYSWNWGAGSQGPSGANAGVAFTGQADFNLAMQGYSTPPNPALKGTRWISFGGGGERGGAGTFTPSIIQTIGNNAAAIKQRGYNAVMFDVEITVGSSNDLVSAFNTAITNLKNAGLQVGVTSSHSGPYSTDSAAVAVALVQSWIAHSSLDILSPQMYTQGTESAPELIVTSNCNGGCPWSLYKNAKAKIVPSIVSTSHYSAVQSFFNQQGIVTRGYFQWQQQ